MIATLQSLRFVFVMMIFMSHMAWQGIGPFDAGGDCGVAFFFILSGYVLSLGYGERIGQGTFSYRTFMLRRLTKLYPLHWHCLLVFLILSHQPVDSSVVLNALLLQSWIPDSSYYFSCNAVSWFLSDMLFLYVMFPLLYRWMSKMFLAVVLTTCLVAYLLTPDDYINSLLYVHPLVRTVDFCLGIALLRFTNATERQLPQWVGWASIALLAVLLAAYPYADVKWRNAPMFWIPILLLIAVVSRQQGSLSRLLSNRLLQSLGRLAMPLFMTHQLVIRVMEHRLSTLSYVPMLLVCLGVTLLVSWLVDRFFLQQIFRQKII